MQGDDTTLHKCDDCGSLWIDVADLNRALLHNNLPGLETLGGKVDAEALTAQCPECQVDLVRITGGRSSDPLSYDTCESCGGILFESGFKDATEASETFPGIVAFFKDFAPKKTKNVAS